MKNEVKCFECGEVLQSEITMEKLISLGLPIFCSIKCSNKFPNNGTKEFKRRLKQLEKEGK